MWKHLNIPLSQMSLRKVRVEYTVDDFGLMWTIRGAKLDAQNGFRETGR